MPIFRSAYDTTFGRRYTTDAAQAAIVKALVSNYLTKNDDTYTIIQDTADLPVDIPAFTHPLYIEKAPYDGLYVDVRPFVSRNRQSGELKITSLADYNLLLARAGLEHIWRTEEPSVLRSMSPFPASVYSSWLAEGIKSRFGLEPEDQYKLTIFSAWFYFSLFSNDDKPDEKEYLRIVQNIHKATKISVEPIMQVLDNQSYVKGIGDFCGRLEEVIGDVRFRNFSSILLYPTINSTWYSANANEMVAVAVEHIPSFMALLLAASTERSFMRTGVSKLMERVPAKAAANDFVHQMTATLKSL